MEECSVTEEAPPVDLCLSCLRWLKREKKRKAIRDQKGGAGPVQ